MNKQMIEWQEFQKKQQKKMEEFKALSFEQRLEITVKKMVHIATSGTGSSQLYVDMLLSMLPNSTHKVNMSEWCYKADRDDFNTILELMQKTKENSQIIWEYEALISPYMEELKQIAEGVQNV